MSKIYEIKSKYNSNSNINKSLTRAPRNNQKFMQDIYIQEVRELISYLIHNLENQDIFPNFESIILYTAKKRKFIELYKLNIGILIGNEKRLPFFMYFGKFRGITRINENLIFTSPVVDSKGEHLVDYITTNYDNYPICYKDYALTWIDLPDKEKNFIRWRHTLGTQIYNLLQEMNKLFEKFKLSLFNKNNKKSKSILSELYWLYMQTCPFFRGSAAIGEIVFSALLQKYFNCDFRLLRESFSPLLIPDIHALTYPLELFQSIFWKQLVSCGNKNSN